MIMVTLTLLDSQSSAPQEHWEFQHDTIKIGRAPDNDVVLNDGMVSRHHLELRRIGNSQANSNGTPTSGQWLLVNQGTNGTFVNGILMSHGIVSDDCLIQLARGGPVLKFQISAQSYAIAPSSLPAPVPLIPPYNQGEDKGILLGGGRKPLLSPIFNPCTHEGNPPGNLFCIHCGQPVVQVQRFIHHYQVLRTLGQGGMGTTYQALDSQRPRGASLVVLKEMNADMAQNSKAKELFEREARTLKTLNHPGIPQYYDFFVEEGKKYLAMELIQGEDLEKRIYKKGPVLLNQAIEWMIQTCDILGYIHSQSPPLIHRDIKPANLMVRYRDNQIVVLDFGAVKEIGTPPGTRIGAPDYSAPEQDRGQPVTQSDLYAIGPTLIFLLSGESPQKYYQRRGMGYRFNVEGVPTITPQLRQLIEKVTEPRPSDRYQSAKELSEALTACL